MTAQEAGEQGEGGKRGSDFEIAFLAANTVVVGRRSSFLCYPFEKPKKNLLIIPDSSVYVHHNTTSITLPTNSHDTHSAYMGQPD